MKKEYCVISHTHWDREWYLPFEQFRIRLIELMGNLIKLMEKETNYIFHLDAQTVVLEDYLDIKPERRRNLEKLITEGRLLVGPWYVQNDFNLTSGESTVRNLQIGIKTAKNFGHCSMVGYTPDQFGLISQLPQILKKFDIGYCIFGRGKDNFEENDNGQLVEVKTKSEFYWESEDGSRIIGIYLPYWYNNAQRFSADIDRAMLLINKLDLELSKTSHTPYYLLMNGVDHLEAQENLLPILGSINENLHGKAKIHQCKLEDYSAKIEDALRNMTPEIYIGEMRSGEDRKILQGTLSSRVDLKQHNARCQTILENYLEPLYTWMAMLGINIYPSEYLESLWKMLIKNHAHDSICGCSADSVNNHIEDRFVRIEEAGQFLLNRALEKICEHVERKNLNMNDYLLTLFNTTTVKRNEVIEAEIYFDSSNDIDEFKLLDTNGASVPYNILEKKNRKIRRFSPVNLPAIIDVISYRVRFFAESVNGQSYKTYIVRPSRNNYITEATKYTELPRIENIMENDYLKIKINDTGTIDILNKKSHDEYRDTLFFEDKEDIGDSYNYKESSMSRTILSKDFRPKITMLGNDRFTTVYSITYEMGIPAKYDFVNKCRSIENCTVPIEVILRLDLDCPYLQVTLNINNTAQDHRLRVFFPTDIITDKSQAGAPFDIIQRDRSKFDARINESACQPFTDFINVDDKNRGIAFFAKGLYEYEHLNDINNTIAITLIRSNSSIYRENQNLPVEDLLYIPGNQCEGFHEFSLAIYPHQGDHLVAEVINKMQAYKIPLQQCCTPSNENLLSRGTPFVQDSAISEVFSRADPYESIILPYEKQIVKIEGKDISLSALKIKDKNTVVIRMYNSSSLVRYANIAVAFSLKGAFLLNMNEDVLSKIETQNSMVNDLEFKPKEIVSIGLTMKEELLNLVL